MIGDKILPIVPKQNKRLNTNSPHDLKTYSESQNPNAANTEIITQTATIATGPMTIEKSNRLVL